MARDNDRTASKTDRELLEEVAGRCRRLETKTTMVANHLGIDAGEIKPMLDREKRILWVKTIKTSLEDIINAIGDFEGPVSVYCGEEYLATVGV
jgi:hypothetical protein